MLILVNCTEVDYFVTSSGLLLNHICLGFQKSPQVWKEHDWRELGFGSRWGDILWVRYLLNIFMILFWLMIVWIWISLVCIHFESGPSPIMDGPMSLGTRHSYCPYNHLRGHPEYSRTSTSARHPRLIRMIRPACLLPPLWSELDCQHKGNFIFLGSKFCL